MAEDIAPALLDKVQKAFKRNLKAAGVNKADMLKRARDGTIKSITPCSEKIGKALSKSFVEVLTPEAMPDGTFYYNIAQKTMIPPIKEAHKMVSDVADEIQAANNARMGLGIKPVRPPIQMERVDGIIDLLTDGFFADNVDYFVEPIKNLVNHFGDYHVEKNAEFFDNSGVGVVVIRRAESTACEWCHDRAGMYDGYYEAQVNEAFARHEGCKCELEIRGKGTSGKMQARGHAFVRA